ncbi:MAG: AAA family ATPase [Treponema sp.]|nr:AAA family ATPase [Treponema sp.]
MKFPVGVQDFEKLLREGYCYVDKTALVYKMVNSGSCYFLSRPRRFGKSLLLTTIKAYLKGKKHLFKGLAIESLEKDWTSYPILHLDLNTGLYNEPKGLEDVLSNAVAGWEALYGKGKEENTPVLRFKGVIQRAFEKTGLPVVVLVDEYDKPLLYTLDNPELQELYRAQLKSFYSVLKTMDGCIKFAFLTGVTKFSKVSIFSDLNNLKDISLDKRYVKICGITKEEIVANFDNEVGLLAESFGITKAECYDRLKKQYDGYHFCENTEGIYNPFSLVNALDGQEFRNYWFETGTPTMLVQVMKACKFNLNDLQQSHVTADLLGAVDAMHKTPLPLLYQSGYLTIADYNADFGEYTLDFPNQEVESGFINFLTRFYRSDEAETEFSIRNFIEDIRSGKADQFMQRMQAFFSGNDYRVAGNVELYFQNALYILVKLMGFHVNVEKATSDGRPDLIVSTKDYIYIMEFKLDQSAQIALQQIKDKKYAGPYALDGRKITLIGVNFSKQKRTIDDWLIEEAK